MAKGRTRHSTLTPHARRAANALRQAGFLPHPGRIDPHGGKGGTVRIKISVDPTRTRIRVAGGGVQEILIYGDTDIDQIKAALARTFGPKAIEAVIQSQ